MRDLRAALSAIVLCAACSSTAPREPVAVTRTDDVAPVAAVPVDAAVEPAAVVDAAPVDPRAERIELTFMGDITFGGWFNGHFSAQDVEKHDPLTAMAPQIASDLALANLETTVMDELPAKLEGNLRFIATPGQVATLPRNGITAVTLANNHANDMDRDGVIATPPRVLELGLIVVGAARHEDPVFRAETVEVRGWRIAVVAATAKLNRKQKRGDPQIPFVDPDDVATTLVPVVEQARPDHDLVIVVLHWGTQYDDEPSRWQVDAAHALVDAGADAVVGHHPHVLQGIERYGKGVIAYSLGNFVFQNGMPTVRQTGVLRLGFARDGACLDALVLHPAVMKRQPVHHPEPVASGTKLFDEASKRVIRLSGKRPLATSWSVDGERLVGPPACP